MLHPVRLAQSGLRAKYAGKRRPGAAHMTQNRPPEYLRTAGRLSWSICGHLAYTSRIRAMSSRSSLPVFTIPCVSPSGQTVTSPAAT